MFKFLKYVTYWLNGYRYNYPTLFPIIFPLNSSFQNYFSLSVFLFFIFSSSSFILLFFSSSFFIFSSFVLFLFSFPFVFFPSHLFLSFSFLFELLCFSLILENGDSCFNSLLYIYPLPPIMHDKHIECMCFALSRQFAN